MPKDTYTLDRSKIVWIKISPEMPIQNPSDQTHAQYDVNSMQTCHAEIKTKVHADVLCDSFWIRKEFTWQQSIMNFVRILKVLDHQEDTAAKDGTDQCPSRFFVLSILYQVN